ncbi:MAG: hypothetical protein KGN34_12015 [Sphingomonadales bacterium]|nr:hypothetical protein [Sphingomonadales bacterium]
MRAFMTLALGAAVLGGVPAMAQPVTAPGHPQDADTANAESMADQGTDRALTPPAPEPRAYPLCSREVHDECVNPREAGRNHGHVPLNYWPGRPASEMH